MNIYNSLFSPNAMLNEQLARQVFEIMPEDGPLVVIMDAQGNCWPSSSEKFESLNLNPTWLKKFCSKIDDGIEPVISHIEKYGIAGTQLLTDRNKYGYVLMAIEEPGPEAMLAKIELVEMVLSQFSLAVKLIEKCNLLYHNQMRLCSPAYSN
jgi:hypothetical protein